MENQHQKISGYRDLTQEEIDLMNECKEAERQLLDLVDRVHQANGRLGTLSGGTPEGDALLVESEAARWASIARTDFQRGFMALVRAVAKPRPL